VSHETKDLLLERAAAAEERLRRLLEGRRSNGVLVPVPAIAQDVGAEDSSQGDNALDSSSVFTLTEPDGTVAWALRLIPEDTRPEHLPDDEPALQTSMIDSLARAVPQIAQALQQGQMFELIGPAAALEGLRNGTMEMITSKTGGLLGAIRMKGGKAIAHQARFRPIKVANAIGPGLAITAASAVLGHMHMVEIRRQLARMEGTLDRVLEGQQAARHGKVSGSAEVLQDVARSMNSTGAPTPLQLHRLIAAELDLRQIAGELEQLHRRYSSKTDGLREARFAAFVDAFGTTRATELDDARLYVAATAALVMVERLLTAYAALAEPLTVSSREVALATAYERLGNANTVLAHLGQFQAHCRRALDQELGRAVRLSTRESERVSEELRRDRLAVADLLSTAHRLVAGGRPTEVLQVVRVDARGGTVRAQVAILDPAT
jgi:hypothetical protein